MVPAPGSAVLSYVADPMCSWCWGFAPEWERVRAELARTRPELTVRLVLGGLASDSDEPMPPATRTYVQGQWSAVERRTGARFDWSFWERCAPRRSTWPACRAVIAAEALRSGAGEALFGAIQRAYCLEARNPSDEDVLVDLAAELDPPLARDAFAAELRAPATAERLAADLALARELGATGFPTVVLSEGGVNRIVSRGYEPAGTVLERLEVARRSGT